MGATCAAVHYVVHYMVHCTWEPRAQQPWSMGLQPARAYGCSLHGT